MSILIKLIKLEKHVFRGRFSLIFVNKQPYIFLRSTFLMDEPGSRPNSPEQMIKPQARALIESLVLNACLSSLMFGYCSTYFNSINYDDISQILGISLERALGQGLLTSCIPISACFGALLSARFLSCFSRKSCFIAFNSICIVSVILIQTKLLVLISVGRLLQGTFIGLASSIVPLYIKEFIPEMNGRYGIFHQMFITGGIVLSFGLNLILYPLFSQEPERYWRFIFCLPLLVAAYQNYMLTYKYNFETPRYLVSVGKSQEAKTLVQMLYKEQYVELQMEVLQKATQKQTNSTVQKQGVQMFVISKPQSNNSFQKEQNSQKQPNLSEALLHEQKILSLQNSGKEKQELLANVCALHVSSLQQLVGIGIVIVYSGEFALDLFPSLERVFPVLIHSVGVFCTYMGVFLIRKFGRTTLLKFGGSVIFFCEMIIGYNFLLQEKGNSVLIIVTMIILRSTFSISLGPIVWMYLPEIIRPTVMPYATLVNWVGATLIMFLFPIAKEWLGNPGWIFILLGTYCGLGTLFNHFCLVESKDKNQIQVREGFKEKQRKIRQFLKLSPN